MIAIELSLSHTHTHYLVVWSTPIPIFFKKKKKIVLDFNIHPPLFIYNQIADAPNVFI